MNRSIFVIFSALTLSGCFYQTVSLNDMQTAIKACDSFENIVEISSHFTGDERVECIDRSRHWLSEDVWQQK